MLGNTVRIVPHSGIQFLRFRVDLAAGKKSFNRQFFERRLTNAPPPDGQFAVQLHPGWDDDKQGEEHEVQPLPSDETIAVSRERALEPFLDQWTPLPLFANRKELSTSGASLFMDGPTNWARVRISAAGPITKDSAPYDVVIALDTEILERRPNRPYLAPSPADVREEREFSLAYRFADIARFLRDVATDPSTGAQLNRQRWVVQWIEDQFTEAFARKRNRMPRADERTPNEPAARYIAFIALLAESLPFERVRLVDTYSEEEARPPVMVDLVLDIGNSRSCGVLIETLPDQRFDFSDTIPLQLHDLERPHLSHEGPFESHVELAQAIFGREHHSRDSMRTKAFFWPSPVRVGPEASRLRERSEGTEGMSGMSSPKRYLCSVAPTAQEWRFHAGDLQGRAPALERTLKNYVNARGDVLRELEHVGGAGNQSVLRFFQDLGGYGDIAEMTAPARKLTFSRSSFLTFMLAEIIWHTLTMINSPEVRHFRKERDKPRRLRRVILSLPTAMPVREQYIFQSRARAAVKLVWDLMGWTENPPPGLVEPRVEVAWDEASCVHFVYLYSEVARKFGGDIDAFMTLLGKTRGFTDDDGESERLPSLRVASVDVGGGTTDVMVTTYFSNRGKQLVPTQNFREGFRVAGDDIVELMLRQIFLPALQRQLESATVSRAREFLHERFGSGRMTEQEKHLRREFVMRVLRPSALAVLGQYEQSAGSAVAASQSTIRTLLGLSESADSDLARVTAFLEKGAASLGADGFSVLDTPVAINPTVIRNVVKAVMDNIFDNVAEAIHHLDCDVVLLAGRPSRLPATVELLVDKLGLPPDRVISLSDYTIGAWYPFLRPGAFRIDDPKTVTVVGSMLCELAKDKLEGFSLRTERLSMRSTANYIGVLERDGKLKTSQVLFKAESTGTDEEATYLWLSPVRLGFRQLPHERWTATPLYWLSAVDGSPIEQLRNGVEITLKRSTPDDLAPYGSNNLLVSEARKEEIRILEAQPVGHGGTARRSFFLRLDTLPNLEGYWLDTGILPIN
jgi:hypothetical protein